MEGTLRTLPLSSIVESKTNPRRVFRHLDELAASIKQTKGVVTPLLVRPLNGKAAGKHEIVAGARRFRATKLAGLEEVACLVREMPDDEVLEVQIIENLQREDPEPMDEARGYKTLIDTGRWDVDSLAQRVGKGTTYVYDRLKLTELTEHWQTKVAEGAIPLGAGLLLARLQDHQQQEAVDELGRYGDGSVTVQEVRRFIESFVSAKLSSAPFSRTKEVGGVGPCKTCPKRTGAAPSLFDGGEGKNDRCLDTKCYGVKVDAFIEEKVLAAEQAGTPLVQISTEYRQGKKEGRGLSVRAYSEIYDKTDRCAHAVPAIVVEGYDKGAKKAICFAPSCKKHTRYRSGGSSGQATAADKKREADLKLTREVRHRAITEALAHVPTSAAKLKADDVVILLDTLSDELWDEHRRRLFSRRGWDQPKSQTRHAALMARVEKMKPAERWRLLFELCFVRRLDHFNHAGPDRLKGWLGRCGVDLGGVRRTVVAERRKAEAAKKAKKRSKKTAAKGKTRVRPTQHAKRPKATGASAGG